MNIPHKVCWLPLFFPPLTLINSITTLRQSQLETPCYTQGNAFQYECLWYHSLYVIALQKRQEDERPRGGDGGKFYRISVAFGIHAGFLPFEKGELKAMPRRMKAVFQSVADQKAKTAMYGPIVCPLHLTFYASIRVFQTTGLKLWSLTVLASIS